MTYIERNEILQSSDFKARCRIALCDWLEYWACNGTESIEDETLREKTDFYIKMCISNVDGNVIEISNLVIGTSIVEEAEEVDDNVVKRALDYVLSNALDYLIRQRM